MIESELEAMTIWEQVRDLVNVVATGGAGKCQSVRWITDLSLANLVLQAFEDDEAADYWTQILRNCVRWPGDKEMAIKEWITYGIEANCKDIAISPLECLIFDADSPLQGNDGDLPTPQQTTSKLQKNRVLSKSETIDILQSEVARLFGGCEVEEQCTRCLMHVCF